MRHRMFIQLPREYLKYFPDLKEYFEAPVLLAKSMYGTTIAARTWSDDLSEWLLNNDQMKFSKSEIDPSLFIHRAGDKYLFLIVYVDDCLYFGSTDEYEAQFGKYLGDRFKLELQGWSHWFLGT